MAYVKGTDAAGGGSTVNKEWVNKVAEEKWAAEQEAKKRREQEEDRDALAAKRKANDVNAQKRREQEEAAAQAKKQEELRKQNEAAQKAAQEKAKAEAYQRSQQEAAAKAAAARQQEAAAQAQREAAAEAARQQREREAAEAQAQADKERELRAQREAAQRAAQEQAKAEAYARAQQEAAARAAAERARQAEQAARQEQMKRERELAMEQLRQQEAERQRQRDAEAAAAAGTSGQSSSNTGASLSYSGAGTASPQTQVPEAQWNIAPETSSQSAGETFIPAATVPDTTTAGSQPANVYEATQNMRRPSDYRAGAQTPVIYTPQSTTSASTAATRTQAANTKAALTGENSNDELLDWIDENPELYNRNVQAWMDSGLTRSEAEANARRNIAGQLGITYQPGTPTTTQPQIRYVPRADTSLDAGLRYPVSKMTANKGNSSDQTAGNVNGRTITLSGQPRMTDEEKIENEQLTYEQGLANYLKNNGAQVDSNGTVPIVEWFRAGQAEQNVYSDAYQAAYDQIVSAGGSYQQADTAAQAAGNMAVRQYRANQPVVETPVSEGTTLYDEMVNAGNARRSGEERAEANMQNSGVNTERSSRNGSVKMTTSGGVSGGNTNQPDTTGTNLRYNPQTTNQGGTTAGSSEQGANQRNGSVKLTTSGGVSGGRVGADAALDDVMNGNQQEYDARTQAIIDAARAAGLTYSGANQPGAISNVTGTTTTTGSKTGEKSGSGSSTSKKGTSGYERAEKNAPGKGTYFKPSYGQDMKSGVKLPYKSGGYTEKELRDAGNIEAGKWRNSNDNFYEGYYLAPDGKYYPVDMEKAAYYKSNGGSYKGWEEPMREYYRTFGTYYGYRPDWKTAGGKNTWKDNNKVYQNYRPAKSSSGGSITPSGTFGSTSSTSPLSYSAVNSGRSYGRGSTPNNGLYWNGNTSWSI